MSDVNAGLRGPMKKILIFCDFYLPGFKSGGGMWTVVNLVDRFCDRYEFFVVTRNYDSKGDTTPFTSVETGAWNEVGNARVFYVAASDLTKAVCARIVNEIRPDCVFLNSAMSTPVVKFLMARRSGRVPDIPVILAPCGELSIGALASKPLKKKAFLAYAKLSGLFSDVLWKASSESEAEEISGVFGDGREIMIAPDLAPKTILPDYSPHWKPSKEIGSARFIFLSRVVPKKNTRYFLERLREIPEGNIVFDIVGPVEDNAYWQECLRVIDELPENIMVNARGAVSYDEGLMLQCSSHFFVLPTLNENFGYVLIESLAAGCPILISDQTMWSEAQERNAGWAIPLDDTALWTETIKDCLEMDGDRYLQMSGSARAFAEKWLADTNIEDATAKVLQRALQTRESIRDVG